jgi:flagellar hook-basal body complex protein FliE
VKLNGFPTLPNLQQPLTTPGGSQKSTGLSMPSVDSSSLGSLGSLGSGSSDVSFRDMLGSAINQVEGARTSANQSIDKFLSGDGEDLHSTILASQRADLEFQMFMQVRNKVVSAYQEVMKMQM